MESEDTSYQLEELEVIKVNPVNGDEFSFKALSKKAEVYQTADMPAGRFLLYALRRIYSLSKGDEMEQEAGEAIPILETLLGEVRIDPVRNLDGSISSYTFTRLLKDEIVIDDPSYPNELTTNEISEVRKFFLHLVTECFKMKAVKFALAMYTQLHKEELISNPGQKKRNRNKAEPKDKSPFRVSGHLVDQKLKYFQPDTNTLAIFDSLRKETKEKIKEVNIERSAVVEGIKLSPSEHKVIDSLCKLLHVKSQTKNKGEQDYYTGNKEAILMPYGVGGRQEAAPQIAFTLYELTKEVMGGESLGGKNTANVYSILQELEKKRFLLSYMEKIHKKDGGRTERKIEEFQPLVRLMKYSEADYNSRNDLTQERDEIIVALNPIFRHQIDSKFILYPHDLNRRTIIAYGSHNIADASYRLRDYLLREHSYGHLEPEINMENLYWMLCEKWMKENRRKKVGEYVERAIQTKTRDSNWCFRTIKSYFFD
jgi:hypothetical protein